MKLDVAIIPREKFSAAGHCIRGLRRIRAQIAEVVFFDTGYPQPARNAVLEALDGFDVRYVGYHGFRLANACLNDLRDNGRSPWILVIENDCELVGGDLVESLGRAQADGFGCIQPRILEADGVTLHYDPPQSYIDRVGESLVHRVIRNPRHGYPAVDGRRRIFHVEKHALLIRRDALSSLGEFETFLVTRSHWDLSFRLHEAGFNVLFDPSLQVRFIGGAIAPMDRDYFYWRWNVEKARRCNDYIQSKWRIANYHSSLEWLENMLESSRVLPGSPTDAPH
jgi:hypothetical protein